MYALFVCINYNLIYFCSRIIVNNTSNIINLEVEKLSDAGSGIGEGKRSVSPTPAEFFTEASIKQIEVTAGEEQEEKEEKEEGK